MMLLLRKNGGKNNKLKQENKIIKKNLCDRCPMPKRWNVAGLRKIYRKIMLELILS